MEGFALKIKRTLQNKDTITFLGIVALIFALFMAYTIRVNTQIKPVTVPYANTTIMAGSKISAEMVSFREVPASMIGSGVIRTKEAIVGKYASGQTVIPSGSLFYEQAIVAEEEAAISTELSFPDKFKKFTTTTSVDLTYGNSIVPGNYVDIWMIVKPELKTNKVLIGKLISNVKIISVRDSTGTSVFQNLDEQLTPAILNFALPSDCFDLLTAAQKISSSFNPQIKYVPTNEGLKDEPGDTEIASEILRDWVSGHVEYVE